MDRPLFLLGVLAASLGAVAQATAADAPPSAIDELVAANRVLAHEDIVDGFGHVSVRHPADPTRYLLARSMAPALVTASDIMTYDLDSNPLDANGRTSYLERFIHGAIYKSRPDVMSVVHAHTPAVIPFGVSTVKLQPIFHMAAFLGAGVPVFEIRFTGGTGTDLLVKDAVLGAALAQTLGTANVALMRGHGMVAVGGSIPEAVFRAYYTAQDAQLESDALRLGSPTYLTGDEARSATKTQAGLVSRSWELWKRAVSGARG
ncbi:MAG TPA: class II aldolase/adducin family protein [Candidatus Elarobacter sp.]|nr:class II aldolase/adducin family protein [Candidatus Elarobacter sp.]